MCDGMWSSNEKDTMDTTMLQDLVMQNVQTLRRAAERSVRGLRNLGEENEGSRKKALQEFLLDSQADLASLHALRKTADELLREGIEAETFRQFCEVALETAAITMKGTAVLENAKQDIIFADAGTPYLAQVKQGSEQAQAMHAHFRRLVEWLGTPPQPLAQSVLEKLHALPPVTEPEDRGNFDATAKM